jgi:hypothetical protein
MVMVKYLANPATGALGDFACSLGGANADVFAGNGRAPSDIACCVYGVEGDEITRTFPDSLGCGAGPWLFLCRCLLHRCQRRHRGCVAGGGGDWAEG